MSYMTTFTGLHFDSLDPDVNLINIEDIAHSLSLQCRANGHYPHLYTVAQHCINCYLEAHQRNYSNRVQLACLLHDASEAYVEDLIRPLKHEFPHYIEIENQLLDIIFIKYLGSTLTEEEHKLVFDIDDAMLEYEFNHMMHESYVSDALPLMTTPMIDFQMPEDIEKQYKEIYNLITIV